MDYTYLVEKYTFSRTAVLDYGFKEQNGRFVLEKEFDDLGLKAVLSLSENRLTAELLDLDTGEIYAPFEVKSSTGVFVSTVRDRVERLINELTVSCFASDSLRDRVLEYAESKENCTTERPWKESPEYVTLKCPNGKWYGIIMNIPQKTLFGESERMVDIINIKLPPEKIESLIDNKSFFKAYHMNKKYWLSILLDSGISFDKVRELLDESYSLVFKSVKR